MSATVPTSGATILGASPAGSGQVSLWLWSQAAGVQTLGTFEPHPARQVAARLLRRIPGCELFVRRGAAL